MEAVSAFGIAPIEKCLVVKSETNENFGVYKSLCCGAEIVIREGAIFPDCPNHPTLDIVWAAIDFEMILPVEIQKKAKSEPAA